METTVWVVKCKQCSLYHRGPLVDTTTDTLNLPLDGPFECVLLGKTARYQSSDWIRMTQSQWREFEQKSEAA
jgi:hypothetical protein